MRTEGERHGAVGSDGEQRRAAGSGHCEGVTTLSKQFERPIDEPSSEWRSDARWLLVQRILATQDFVRSPRLVEFLTYVCRMTLEGRSGVLNEQHIGEVVFGRAPDYDSAADTIVRSHALRLRRRLDQYAQRAGREDQFRLEIPRGAYVPVFLPVEERGPLRASEEQGSGQDVLVEEDTSQALVPTSLRSLEERDGGGALAPVFSTDFDVELPATADAVSARVGERRSSLYDASVLILSCAVVFTSALAFVFYRRATSIRTETHHELWSELFTRDQPTRIVLGDSGLVLFHAVTWRYVSLQEYLDEDYGQQMESLQHVDPQFAAFLRGRRYTSMVDATTLGHLLRLPQATPDRTLVQYARDMRLNDFKNGNLILLGAEEADPWVELFEKSMDFVFSSNTPDHHAGFMNRHPREREQTIYLSNAPKSANKLYAIVAFLPNLSATGHVLLLEGSNMAGTESAVDFIMDDQRLLPLLRDIRRPDGSLPHFELLLESDTVKDSAEPARVVAIHVHPS